MKHLLIALLLMLSFSTMAQKYALNAQHFIMADETGIIDNDKVDVDMVLDIDKSRLVIYSKEPQIIDYKIIRNYIDKDNYSVTETAATDTKWKDIFLTFYINSEDETILIHIIYPSYMYIYVCKVI